MIREKWRRPTSIVPLLLPFYIINTPTLTVRRNHAISELKKVGVIDITTVHCGNPEDFHNVSCIHNVNFKSRGTLSLAIKHLLSARDMQTRRLHAAAIVEDDIELVPHFADSIMYALRYTPIDARMFHFASYRKEYHHFRDVLKYAKVPNTTIYRRVNQTRFIGTTGYILFAPYLHEILCPIKAAYDIHFSQQMGTIQAPQPTYGSSKWLGGQSRKFKAGTHVNTSGIVFIRNKA